MTFQADYPGAIVVEAAQYGYAGPNRPKTWGFHTPEEPADTYPSTPEYLATADRDASYTYFASYLGFIFQLVPESEGAYAHGLDGKPAPSWSDGTNLNLQSFSLSFEGHAATIHQTMLRGSPQWKAGVQLVAHRTKALGLSLVIAFQHKEVSKWRSDCGQWDQASFIADVKTKMDLIVEEEDDDMSKHIHSPSKVGMELFGYRRELTNDQEHQAIHAMGYVDQPSTDEQWSDLRDFPFGSGGSDGLSFEETVKADQEAVRRGTGAGG